MKNIENLEYIPLEDVRVYQELKLRELLNYVATRSPFYKRMFQTTGINPLEITCLESLQKLPVTTKEDLQHFNNDFLCVGHELIIDYVTTSGTLGDPVTFALTEADLKRLARNEALSFMTAGCNSHDIIQLMTTIDRRFMAGLAYFLGSRELGSAIVRVGNGIPELQWDTIHRVFPTTCIVVPSFLLKLIDYARENDIDYHNCSLRRAICIGEPLRNPDYSLNTLGQKIADLWPELSLHSTYASTEMQTSFTECSYFAGGHHQPELIIVEFLDEYNQPVREGEAGEVTITTLGVEGMPLLRFKTGDICYFTTQKCACGRTTTRLSPVIGRKGQMIKFKGTTLYPGALYDVLDNISGLTNYIVEVYTNSIGTDEIHVRVGSENHTDEFKKHIKDAFRSKIRVAPEVSFEDPSQISLIQNPVTSRKLVKFIDHRLRGGDYLH
ncbi:MAG: AMP-binding protein [Sphingobacteriia bacterium]|nr:AMP-binding protein [Sphingobacteriia bacterium]